MVHWIDLRKNINNNVKCHPLKQTISRGLWLSNFLAWPVACAYNKDNAGHSSLKIFHIRCIFSVRSDNEICLQNRQLCTEYRFPYSQLDQKNILNNLLFEISRFLLNARIDIHYAYFSPSEIVLILNNDDAVKLYDMLHEK